MSNCGKNIADTLTATTVLGKDCEGNIVHAGATLATCKDIQGASDKADEALKKANQALAENQNDIISVTTGADGEVIVETRGGTVTKPKIDTDQAKITADATGITLTNEDGTKFKVTASTIKTMIEGDYIDNSELATALAGINTDQVKSFAVEGDNVVIANEDNSKVRLSRTDLINLLNNGMVTDAELTAAIAGINTDQATITKSGNRITLTNENGWTSYVDIEPPQTICQLNKLTTAQVDSATNVHLAACVDGANVLIPNPSDVIPQISTCPMDGHDRPTGVMGNFFLAMNSSTPTLMVIRDDGKFYPVGEFTSTYAQAMNGRVLNGKGVLNCNVNFRNVGMEQDSDIRIDGSKYGWCSEFQSQGTSTTGTLYQGLDTTVPDEYILYNSANEYRLSFDFRWTELTPIGQPPENYLVYLLPFDGDKRGMARLSFYPSPYGADMYGNLQGQPFQAQAVPTAWRNGIDTPIILTQDLYENDTQIHLSDTSFWVTHDAEPHHRFLRFLGYADNTGNTYKEYSQILPIYRWSTYSSDQTTWGQWNQGAITGNTINLHTSFPRFDEGGVVQTASDGRRYIPAGTMVANSHTGRTYNYVVNENRTAHPSINKEWHKYDITIPPASKIEVFPTELSSVKISTIFDYFDNNTRQNLGSKYRTCYANFNLVEV